MKTGMIILTAAAVMAFGAAAIAEVQTNKLEESIGRLTSYTYGNTKGVDLRWVELQIGMASGDKSVRGRIEQKLIDALAAATTNDAKQFFCRQLRTIGTARAVPQLESMLRDSEISHMARYALGRIDAPEAGKALHRALGKTSGKIKAGIINTLVNVNYTKASTDILKFVGDSDKNVSIAAIKTAGAFGGKSAVKMLQKARPFAAKDVKVEIDAALLSCASKFIAAGDNSLASAIYTEFYSDKYPEHLRVAGLRGLATTRGEEAADILVEAIKGDDPALRRNAIGMMALIKGKKTTDAFVKLSKSLPPDGQELIVRSLAERGDVSAVPAVIDMTASEHENVRQAALEALGDIGTPQSIKYLARAAASGSREERIARASLVRMRGPGIDKAFISEISSGEPTSRVAVIRAIGQRGSDEPFATLHKVAKADSDASVRREAVLSMSRVGKSSDIDILLKLAIAPKEAGDRSAIERAIVIMFNKIGDKSAQADPVIAALKKAPNEAKPVLLSLLVRPATSEALEVVRAYVKSSNSKVSDAAIRALGQWPNAAPSEQLYQIASRSSNPIHKVLALRSYIRMAPLTREPMAAYINAMKLASRKDDIRLVLGGLHYAGSLEALEMAEKYMTDDALKAEAYMAGVKVANVFCWQDGARARITLNRVIAEAPNDSIRNQARKVINKMAKYKGLVVAWRGAGPYTIDGVNDGRKVFERPFAPEKNPDAKDIVWKVILPEFEGDNRINLEKTFGGIDYCCAYLRTVVHCPAAQDVKIGWSVDDYIRGWMNGQPIEGNKTKLHAGANTLMLKVGDHGGGWNFRCQLLRPDGSPIDGLRFEME
jgi:HEAT repeat protein